VTNDDFNEQFDLADGLADAMTKMSELLTGQVRVLQREGWTEQQARDLVVAVFMSNARGVK
jgi:hypothetical protein